MNRAFPQHPASHLDRYFWVATAILLGILAASQIGSAIQESPTNDEPVHLTAGYVYLTTGQYDMDIVHPPLGRVIAALPLLALPLRPIPADRVWVNLGTLIRDNPVPPLTVILCARLMVIALTLLFGAWLSWWTRCQFGSPGSVTSAGLFHLRPQHHRAWTLRHNGSNSFIWGFPGMHALD